MQTIDRLFGFKTEAGDFDLDFFELAKRTKVTFDEKFLYGEGEFLKTPFKEISRVNNRYLAEKPKFKGTYLEYLNEYLKAFENVLKRINPNEKYLFSCSSGLDSRIIAGTMLKLQRQGYDFSNVHFLTWVGSEVESFKQLMWHGGWNNYTILDDKGENPYNIGRADVPVYGWHSYTNQMEWWKGFNPKEYILLSGAMGEIIQWDFERWYYTGTWFMTRGEIIHKMQKVFKGVLFPMLSDEVLNVSASSPVEWKNIFDPRSGRDRTRTDLVELLGLIHIPFLNCVYNWGLTERVKDEMMRLYRSGQFFKDYGKKINPFIDQIHLKNDAMAWGFGVTIYDRL